MQLEEEEEEEDWEDWEERNQPIELKKHHERVLVFIECVLEERKGTDNLFERASLSLSPEKGFLYPFLPLAAQLFAFDLSEIELSGKC